MSMNSTDNQRHPLTSDDKLNIINMTYNSHTMESFLWKLAYWCNGLSGDPKSYWSILADRIDPPA